MPCKLCRPMASRAPPTRGMAKTHFHIHTPPQRPSPRSVLIINTTVNLMGSLNRGDACSWCHASQAVQVQEPALAAAKLHSQEAIPGATRLHCTHRRA